VCVRSNNNRFHIKRTAHIAAPTAPAATPPLAVFVRFMLPASFIDLGFGFLLLPAAGRATKVLAATRHTSQRRRRRLLLLTGEHKERDKMIMEKTKGGKVSGVLL
jgi:hypothetical protein